MQIDVYLKLEAFLKDQGFSSFAEMDNLISLVDVSTPENIAELKRWQHDDGSKAGLLKLINNKEIV